MVKDFENKGYWALILGGSSGLGLATAHKLAQHGMNICIIHRNPRVQLATIHQKFEAIKKLGVEVITYNIDALNHEKSKQVVTEIKNSVGKNNIRVLLHSIAKGNLKPMVSDNGNELSSDDFAITLNAMATSLYHWVQLIFKQELFVNSARVISFTSEGNTKAWQNYGAVSAAKVALEAITRNIALEFAPHYITANCIQAGVTNTNSLRMIPNSDQIIAHSLQRNPYHRLTTPQDVANAVYLLCKDEARWINGTIIKVDGGEHLS